MLGEEGMDGQDIAIGSDRNKLIFFSLDSGEILHSAESQHTPTGICSIR